MMVSYGVEVVVGMMHFLWNQDTFFQYELNWWQGSKFDSNNNFQDWGQCTIRCIYFEKRIDELIRSTVDLLLN